MKRYCIVAALVVFCASLEATPIANTTGLLSPAITITFDEIVVSDLTPITNQFAGYGATFQLGVTYNPYGPLLGTAGISGSYVGNFGGTGIPDPLNPFSIYFTVPQKMAAFSIATRLGDTTLFEALLTGTLVESFSNPTSSDGSTPYYFGFKGIVFDEIRVTVESDRAVIDNLQIGVPEPATWMLVAGAIPLLALLRRRRKSNQA